MLKDLLDYLNKEIYPFMDKEQVKIVKPNSLTRGLMAEIDKYSKHETMKALKKRDEDHKRDTKSLENTIERLKQGVNIGNKKEYRKGRFGES